jgi:hypothetical protein
MQTMTRDLVKHYSGQMESLIETLKFSVSSMTLTSDIWSGRDKEDCISIVAHYVNYDWGLEKKTTWFKAYWRCTYCFQYC